MAVLQHLRLLQMGVVVVWVHRCLLQTGVVLVLVRQCLHQMGGAVVRLGGLPPCQRGLQGGLREAARKVSDVWLGQRVLLHVR